MWRRTWTRWSLNLLDACLVIIVVGFAGWLTWLSLEVRRLAGDDSSEQRELVDIGESLEGMKLMVELVGTSIGDGLFPILEFRPVYLELRLFNGPFGHFRVLVFTVRPR